MPDRVMPTHATSAANPDALLRHQWTPQPDAGAWVKGVAAFLLGELPWAREFSDWLHRESGNRFADLMDTVFLAEGDPRLEVARDAGWEPTGASAGFALLDQPLGIFPTIAVGRSVGGVGVELKVEGVADFLAAHRLTRAIEGQPLAPYRRAVVIADHGASLSVAERHGTRGYATEGQPKGEEILAVAESFRTRPRDFHDVAEGIAATERLIDEAMERVGRDVACDLFFAAERTFWTARNRAAQAQKSRQDRLGIGWANHDHHTYRSSREGFAPLVLLWEKLGLVCRERFYAGRAAGWGAQVMEQPVTRVVTFNDVDLTPEELMGDFSHDGLDRRETLATIGLWCGLHGESCLQAGMHHLECTFDFGAIQEQLAREHAIRMMKPFTDFPYLRQAFTEGERWSVDPIRVDRLLSEGSITPAQAATFRAEGAIGSHLENLERNDGFKGFNQNGVSEIIAATDPRRQVRPDASRTETETRSGTR